MKSSDCQECRHHQWRIPSEDMKCNKGHRPRFFHPKSPIDTNWGYRRICEDFDNEIQRTNSP